MKMEHSPLPAVTAALRSLSGGPDARLLAEVDARDLTYPFGSGQGDEIALRSGLRPLIRELLTEAEAATARARFEAGGFLCAVASRDYGPTRDGWDYTPDPSALPAGHRRRALFVGRDRGRIDDAIASDLAKSDAGDRELGRLLGYPRCGVEAFLDCPPPRKNAALSARSCAATEGALNPRLKVLDLGVFHYLSWYPYSYTCAPSSAYADALARRIEARASHFVRQLDRALGRRRLLLHDEVQLSIDRPLGPEGLSIETARPTARDRPPRSILEPDAREAVACALGLLRTSRRLKVDAGRLFVDDVHVPLPVDVLLAPFGRAAR